MAEPRKRTSENWCSCGYRNRKGPKGFHGTGMHHKVPKKVKR